MMAAMRLDCCRVALLAEGVDRNSSTLISRFRPKSVALLAEGVDRNPLPQQCVATPRVALLAEGVDRNRFWFSAVRVAILSPSSRRAWIEIKKICFASWKAKGRPPRGGRG